MNGNVFYCILLRHFAKHLSHFSQRNTEKSSRMTTFIILCRLQSSEMLFFFLLSSELHYARNGFIPKLVFSEWYSLRIDDACSWYYCWKFASIAPLNHKNKITFYCLDKVNNICEKLYTGNVTWITRLFGEKLNNERRSRSFFLLWNKSLPWVHHKF